MQRTCTKPEDELKMPYEGIIYPERCKKCMKEKFLSQREYSSEVLEVKKKESPIPKKENIFNRILRIHAK
jgi:hypothetical protein